MKDIPIRFSDVIEDLNKVDIIYYSDGVNGGIVAAFVIKVIGDTGHMILATNQIVDIRRDSNDNTWWFGGQKLHVLVAGE